MFTSALPADSESRPSSEAYSVLSDPAPFSLMASPARFPCSLFLTNSAVPSLGHNKHTSASRLLLFPLRGMFFLQMCEWPTPLFSSCVKIRLLRKAFPHSCRPWHVVGAQQMFVRGGNHSERQRAVLFCACASQLPQGGVLATVWPWAPSLECLRGSLCFYWLRKSVRKGEQVKQ